MRALGLHDFATTVMPLRAGIYSYACSLLGSRGLAEDVTQEVLLRLWQRRGELSGVRNLAAFATRITRNLCVDHRRRALASKRLAAPASEMAGRDPVSRHETRELFRLVLAATRRLPRNQRRILLLRDAAGCSFDEIEAITGLRQPNIRMQLSRARRRVRRLVEERMER